MRMPMRAPRLRLLLGQSGRPSYLMHKCQTLYGELYLTIHLSGKQAQGHAALFSCLGKDKQNDAHNYQPLCQARVNWQKTIVPIKMIGRNIMSQSVRQAALMIMKEMTSMI